MSAVALTIAIAALVLASVAIAGLVWLGIVLYRVGEGFGR